MGVIVSLGVAGSVASLVGLLLPAREWKSRTLHAAYGLVIAVLAGLFAVSQSRLARIERIERAAAKLVAEREMGYTNAGYVQAGLAFLETNREFLPDTYERARALCRERDCWGIKDPVGDVSVAFAMEGLLKAVATVHEIR